MRIYRVREKGETIGFLSLVFEPERAVPDTAQHDEQPLPPQRPPREAGTRGRFSRASPGPLLSKNTAWDVFVYQFSYSFSRFPGLFPESLLDGAGVFVETDGPAHLLHRLRKVLREILRGGHKVERQELHEKKYRNRLEQSGSYRP